MSTPSVICPSNISEVKHATQNLTTEIAISFKSSHRLAKKRNTLPYPLDIVKILIFTKYQKMLRLSSLYCTHEDWSTTDNRTCSYCTVGSISSLAKIKNSYPYSTLG